MLGWECDDLKRKDFRNISQVLLCTFLIYCFICILKFICFFCNTFLQEEACKEERRGQMFMNRLCRTTSRFALFTPIFLRLFSLFGSGVGVLSQNSNRLYFVSKVNLHELRVWMDFAFDLCTTLYFEALVFSESTACVSGHIVMPMSVEYSTEKTDLHLRLARTGMKGICYSPSL